MIKEVGRVTTSPGSREPSQSALSRPVGFDPSRICECDSIVNLEHFPCRSPKCLYPPRYRKGSAG